MTPRPHLIAAVGLLALISLSGCSLGSAGGSTAAGSPTPSPTRTIGSATEEPSDSPSAKGSSLSTVPGTCPATPGVAISLKVDVRSVDPNQLGDKLECTYYNTAAPGKAVVIVLGPTDGASESNWATQFQGASAKAVSISGVADGAFYSVPGGTGGALNFYSGGVIGYIYVSGAAASPNQFVALVKDFILDPN